MDIQQLNEIMNFYKHFLAKIRLMMSGSQSDRQKDEHQTEELIDWLARHKFNKTFGTNCRHEIMYMIDQVADDSLAQLEKKISTLQLNCELITLELEEKHFQERVRIKSGHHSFRHQRI